jgi:hypothetical protein
LNAERLHAVALALREDLNRTQLTQLMDQLATALAQSVQTPQEPSYQQQMAAAREQLVSGLRTSRVNEFPDSWRLVLVELGVQDIVGFELLEGTEGIFARNEITLSTASTEITELNTRVQRLAASLDQLLAGFEEFGIGSEQLGPGEFEVGFLIPRDAVDNELEQLGKEFTKLDSILGPFAELAGENRPDLQVRSIASSDFQLFLIVMPGLALTMAKVVESLLASYEKIRNMRAKAGSLQDDDDVPPEALEGLLSHANERMERDIEALAGQMVEEVAVGLPPGREHELRNDVTRSLRQLAKRIDEGYSIEVHAYSPPEEPPADGEEVALDLVADAARQITSRQPQMRRMNLTGRPILELPEADDDNDGDGDGEAA